MKLSAADYSHKLANAAPSASAAIAQDNVAYTVAASVPDSDSMREYANCSAGIDGSMMELVHEMHPEFRPLCCARRKVGNGEHLFLAGDQLDAVYIVQSGIFKRYFKNEAGAETVADFARRGQPLGIEASLHGTASMSAMALGDDASVCALPLAALDTVPDTSWSTWLMSTICEERRRERVLHDVHAGESTPESRIAFFLLEHATSYSERGELCAHSVPLAIPQQDIAAYLDLDLSAVAHAFLCLQQAGIIRIERTALTVVAPDFLSMLAVSGNDRKSLDC